MPLFSEEEIFIVTGASSGIGRAVAVKLISENASVIAIGRNEERLTKLRSEVLYPQNLYIEAVDLVSQLSDMPSFLKQLKEKYGKFSGIAYCAGAILLKPASETTYEESLDLFKINYFVPTMIIKSLLDKRICVGKGTSAIAVASADAFLREKGLSIYSGTKAALQATLATLAKEVAPRGMRVNTISPSDIKTPMTDNMQSFREGRELQYPFGYGEPEDVAELATFLLSKKSKWITGHDYIVDCASF